MVLAIAGGVLAPRAGSELIVCHAGSVQAAFSEVERAFAKTHPAVDVKDVSGGSVALAARLATGLQPCDVYAGADYLDIDLLLKPAGLADHTIVFARGRMVLAYLATDPRTAGVAAPGDFRPPHAVPQAAVDWYRVLLAPGVRISTSHPFLDPGGYRAHMMFQLAQAYYKAPDLAAALSEHVAIAATGADPRPALGTDYDFQFIYEHSAAAAARSNPAYRYVTLPDRIDLSSSALNHEYAQASITMPAIGPAGTAPAVTIPAARVAWGVTIPKRSANRENAMAFVALLLGEPGAAALRANGPDAIAPALVSADDYRRLPAALKPLVRSGAIAP